MKEENEGSVTVGQDEQRDHQEGQLRQDPSQGALSNSTTAKISASPEQLQDMTQEQHLAKAFAAGQSFNE